MIKKLKDKKFSIIYFLSFLVYPMILWFNWIYYLGDYTCVALVILLAIFELTYIIFLRRKENVGLGRSIARGFLYALFSLNLLIFSFLADLYINGYVKTAFLSSEVLGEYYGFEAITEEFFSLAIFTVTFPVFVIYCIVYLAVSKAIKNKKQKISNKSN